MKKASIIVSAIAAYALFELSLLMLITIPWNNPLGYPAFPDWFREIACYAQLILIPGMAVVVRRQVDGKQYGWRRALVTLLVGGLPIPAIIFSGVSVGLFIEWLQPQSQSIPILILVVTALLLLCTLVVVVRVMRRRSVRLEAESWLARRHSTGTLSTRQRSRAVRFALCIPSLLVLLVFLFFPEAWGALWHISDNKSSLPGYRIPVPATWFVIYGDEASNYLSGMGGTGIAKGFRLHHYLYVPLSNWEITVAPFDPVRHRRNELANEPVVSSQSFSVGNESMTCTEHSPQHLYGLWNIRPSQLVYVECSGVGQLRASLFGDRAQLSTFYKMISGIKPNP